MNSYYFRYDKGHVLEVVRAYSFLEAKQKAFHEYADVWDKVQWIEPIHPPIPAYSRAKYRK